MADITMCVNESCPQKKSCYRHLAIPSTYQSYAEFNYDNGCDNYWLVESDFDLLMLDQWHDDRNDEEILATFTEEDFI